MILSGSNAKAFGAIVSLVALGMVAACGSSDSSEGEGGDGDQAATICVALPATNPASTAFSDGFQAAIKQDLPDATVDVRNAENDAAAAQTIQQQFVGNVGCDVIVDFGTAPAQASMQLTQTIPIVAVSTVLVEPGIVESLDKPGRNVTGVLFSPPVETSVDALLEIKPDAKSLGVIWKNGDLVGDVLEKRAEEHGTAKGLTVEQAPITSPSDVPVATRTLVSKDVDAIFVSCDTTTTAASDGVIAKATTAKIPVLGCLPSAVEAGALLSANNYDYTEVGAVAADQVGKVLDGTDPGTIPVAVLKEEGLLLNEKVAADLGLTIPQSVLDNAIKQ